MNSFDVFGIKGFTVHMSNSKQIVLKKLFRKIVYL